MTISPSTSASTGSRLPSFIVIGAARSGTTALYRFLRQHPRIFMSRNKEPNFFAFEGQALDYRGPGAEFVADSPIGTLHSLRISVFKTVPGKTKQGCVHFVSIENAHITLQGFIPGTRFDLLP